MAGTASRPDINTHDQMGHRAAGIDPHGSRPDPPRRARPESCRWDLNPGPRPYQGRALPTEPRQHGSDRMSRLSTRRPTFRLPAASSASPPRAGDGNRTHVACLEGRYSTIELHPRGTSSRSRVSNNGRWRVRGLAEDRFAGNVRFGLNSSSQKVRRRIGGAWVEQDSNLRRQCHQIYSLAPLATWVSTRFSDNPSRSRSSRPSRDPSAEGRGPTRQIRAGGESRTHNRRFTKPVLCRLSYASRYEAVKFPNIPTESAFASDFPAALENSTAEGGPARQNRPRRRAQSAGRARSTKSSRREATRVLS